MIGLDLSLNSTGICVLEEGKNPKYFIIAGKMTKKMASFSHKQVSIIEYHKSQPDKNDEFVIREQKKTANIYNVVECIRKVVKKVKGDKQCVIEGISYGSTGSAALADLAGLNYAVRCMLMSEGIAFVIVSPMQLKKFAVGNGGADKEVMVAAWKMCQPSLADIDGIKIDDIADAYFLASCGSIQHL